jgi:hypothetical protein
LPSVPRVGDHHDGKIQIIPILIWADTYAFAGALAAGAPLATGSVVDAGADVPPVGTGGFPDGAAFEGPPVGDDPVAVVLAPAVDGGEAASPGSEAGGKTGKAEQNQPKICVPGQVRVPDALS